MKRVVGMAGLLTFSSFLMADIVQIAVVPAAWKLENYIGDNVVAWYAGTPCQNGKVSFPSNATRDDKNRFWATVLAGKMSGKEIFVWYKTDTVNCEMISFGFSQE